MDVQPRYFVAISITDSRFCCDLIWHKHTENTLTRSEKVSEHQHCMSESDHWWIGERLLDVCVLVSFALLAHSDFVHKIWLFRVSHSTTCLIIHVIVYVPRLCVILQCRMQMFMASSDRVFVWNVDFSPHNFDGMCTTQIHSFCYLIWHMLPVNTLTKSDKVSEHQLNMS